MTEDALNDDGAAHYHSVSDTEKLRIQFLDIAKHADSLWVRTHSILMLILDHNAEADETNKYTDARGMGDGVMRFNGIIDINPMASELAFAMQVMLEFDRDKASNSRSG